MIKITFYICFNFMLVYFLTLTLSTLIIIPNLFITETIEQKNEVYDRNSI